MMKIGKVVTKADRELIHDYLSKGGIHSNTSIRACLRAIGEKEQTRIPPATITTVLSGDSPITALTLPTLKELRRLANLAKSKSSNQQTEAV